jgi:hypothetical protein
MIPEFSQMKRTVSTTVMRILMFAVSDSIRNKEGSTRFQPDEKIGQHHSYAYFNVRGFRQHMKQRRVYQISAR